MTLPQSPLRGGNLHPIAYPAFGALDLDVFDALDLGVSSSLPPLSPCSCAFTNRLCGSPTSALRVSQQLFASPNLFAKIRLDHSSKSNSALEIGEII